MRSGIVSKGGILGAVILTVAGCASAGGGPGEALTWDAGLATPSETEMQAVQILSRHGYDIARQEGPPSPYIETSWRAREPFDDEREMGVGETRTRFIVEARPRRQDPDGEDVYTVRVRVENQGRGADAPGWSTLEPTRQFRDYADGIAREVRAALDG